MSTLSREQILHKLSHVIDPITGRDVVASGRVSGVVVRGGRVGFVVNTTPQEGLAAEPLRQLCEASVAALPGVEKVTAVLTAEQQAAATPPPTSAPTPATASVTAPPATGVSSSLSGANKQSAQWNRTPIEGVERIIAVVSGKGGVGKSTTTVCLALALAQEGKRVGILDADIYGPSIPTMLGLSGQPPIEGTVMLPLEKHGIRVMSMGFILGDAAAVMRAPMITKALSQMLRQVQWGELDILLVDMPPGTGDVHLSLVQQAPLSGALVVTTPQQVATLDAQKAIQMLHKVEVPLLGVIENMGYLEHPSDNTRLYPFGQGGGAQLAEQEEVALLGVVPLLPELGAALDTGALQQPPAVFAKIAQALFHE